MNRNIKKLALFLPNPSPFYMSLFFAIKKGFEQADIQVIGWPQLLEKEPLLEFCRQYNPDILFEMNRSRAQIPYLPKKILHIAWIVDLMGHSFEYFRHSDIIYLFGCQWVERYKKRWNKTYQTQPNNLIKWLPPGFSPEIYYHEDMEPIVDFSFAGHIPLPWTQAELDRIIPTKNGKSLSFKDIYEFYCQPLNLKIVNKIDESVINRITGEPIDINNPVLKYDLNVRIGRMIHRHSMMDCLLSTNRSIHIYGPQNWQKWPKYEPYYKYFITNPHNIRKVFLTSKINIHEGNGAHFRIFDCMGSGGCLFYHKDPYDAVDMSGLEALFEADTHYVLFTKDDITQKSKYYIDNTEARKKMGYEAFKLVSGKHKWSDRINEILEDIKMFLN